MYAPNQSPSLRKEIGAKRDICGELHFEAVRRIKRLQFIFLEFYFFRDTESGSVLPLNLSWLLSPLSLTLHIVKSHALSLLFLPCYLVKLEAKTVGLLAIQERRESLVVASLGVARRYRRLGIGTCILRYVETTAKHRGRRSLEVDVYEKNAPAQRLYASYGFTFSHGARMRNMMKGSKRV